MKRDYLSMARLTETGSSALRCPQASMNVKIANGHTIFPKPCIELYQSMTEAEYLIELMIWRTPDPILG